MPNVEPELLETFCGDILAGAGMETPTERIVAHHLVEAEMKGVVSHGVNRVAYYLDLFENGGARPVGAITATRRTSTVVHVDGGGGLGIPAMEHAVDELLDMGRDQAIVCAGITDVAHTCRMGAYSERLARAGKFAVGFGGGGSERFPLVAAHGGRGGTLSTNPWALAMEAGDAGMVSADFATCVVANGKVSVRRRTGEPVPEGWLIDSQGNPTTSIDAYDDGGALLPAGAYKGSALATIAELVGGAMLGDPFEFNWLLIALDVDAFGMGAGYAEAAAREVARIRATPPAPGFDKVRIAGDPEAEKEALARAQGITLHDGVWQGLIGAAAKAGVAVPENLAA
ncbi:MAG: Ldh family oxidoreductase [Alphaproteobacteria bacterium]|nr:Ldh family oxidoreductase [Alphaproteobacteria bacterium]